jgi:hypothetical protein
VADFNRVLGQRHVTSLADDGTYIGFIEWIPDADGNPHSCAYVRLENTFNDSNLDNNDAQENLEELTSNTASPYDAVQYQFTFQNPYDHARLFYFRTDGVPAGWTHSFTRRKALLAPQERIQVALTLKPPDDAPVCTDHAVGVTGWVSRGDTLVQVGGGTAAVDLRRRTAIETKVGVRSCREKLADKPVLRMRATHPATGAQLEQCAVIEQAGCTNPPRPFEEVILRYEDPAGNPVYHTVITDQNGCFEDFYVVTEGGPWEATAEYRGSDCNGPAIAKPTSVEVPLGRDHDQDDDGVPDEREHSSDADGDGLPGQRDPDSDGDGVLDRDEPAGDFDGDGFVNPIDPDSDRDGVIDGQDSTPWGDVRPCAPADPCRPLCPRDRWLVWVLVVAAILTFFLFVGLFMRLVRIQ